MEAAIKLSKTCCLYVQRPLWSTQEAPLLFYNAELHPAAPHKCFYSHSYQIFMFKKSVCVVVVFFQHNTLLEHSKTFKKPAISNSGIPGFGFYQQFSA